MFPHQFLGFFDTFECTKNLCNLGYECCCRDSVCKGCMMVSNIEIHFAHNTHIFYTKYDLEIYCCSKTIRYQQFQDVPLQYIMLLLHTTSVLLAQEQQSERWKEVTKFEQQQQVKCFVAQPIICGGYNHRIPCWQ